MKKGYIFGPGRSAWIHTGNNKVYGIFGIPTLLQDGSIVIDILDKKSNFTGYLFFNPVSHSLIIKHKGFSTLQDITRIIDEKTGKVLY